MKLNSISKKLIRHIPILSKVQKMLDTLEGQNQELRARLSTYCQQEFRCNPQYSSSDLSKIDGLPLPHSILRDWVAGKDDVNWFMKSGKLGAQTIVEILGKQGITLNQFEFILDFGCGCGRVIRHLHEYESIKLHGTDCNKASIKWCDENLNFAEFSTNLLEPPTRYQDNSFDLIYIFSVLTHLTENLQIQWMQEFHRILKPNGYMIITVHGDYYMPQIPEPELAKYQQGELIVLFPEKAGQNECAAFHPESYVRNMLVRNFDVVDFIPEGALGNPSQDAYLLRSLQK